MSSLVGGPGPPMGGGPLRPGGTPSIGYNGWEAAPVVADVSGPLGPSGSSSGCAPPAPGGVNSGGAENSPHPSHKMRHGGGRWAFCEKCGGYGVASWRSLGGPCEGKPTSPYQRCNLRRLLKGSPPLAVGTQGTGGSTAPRVLVLEDEQASLWDATSGPQVPDAPLAHPLLSHGAA